MENYELKNNATRNIEWFGKKCKSIERKGSVIDSALWEDAELNLKRTYPSFGTDAKVNFNHQNETLKYRGEQVMS